MFIEYNGRTPQVHPSAFVAPTAVLIGDVHVGEEASVWFGVVLRGDNGRIEIGARSNVQDNSVLHVSVDCVTSLGTGVTVGHNAFLEDCSVGDGSLIGVNAVVLNGAKVGKRVLIGAGAVVGANAEIPDETVAVGAPAQVKKKLEGVAAAWLDHASPEYVELSRSYLHHGIGDPEVHEIAEAKGA